MTALLEASGVNRSFGPVRALDDVSLAVRPGEVVALAGENGSGKSTLARIIAGALQPDAGTLHIDGTERRFTRPRDALAHGVAMVSQEPTAVPDMTVAENVMLAHLPSALARTRRRPLRDRARVLLEEVGLEVDPSLPLGALAPAQRELVEIAKALASEPHLLILDEATTRLSHPERLFEIVERRARERSMGTIFITHRLREIRRLADRVVVLRDGRLAGELDRSEASDERIAALMVGRPLSDFFGLPRRARGEPVLEVSALVTDRSPHPVDLVAHAGEVLGVAGLVGSGRSELLETIGGARRARGGDVRVAGEPVGGSPERAIAAGIRLVPEDRWRQALVREHSIVANVSLGSHRALRPTDRRAERRRAADCAERFGVRAAHADMPVGSLSGGNAQKVVLGRALAHPPRVLLLDEPTRGVDVGAKAEIYEIIGRMLDEGVAVVLASSDLLEIIGLCDRVVVLHDGSVAGELARGELEEERIALLSAGGSAAA